jgi:DNA-binding response OmpR family regulator
MRILIIDDDPAILSSLRMVLEYERHDVVWATTAEAGLALFECAAPDIVLLDVEMPGIDGLDVLRKLHATHESTPVVMMSAERLATSEAMCAGAAAFLEKPFKSTADLLKGIKAAMFAA